MKRRVSALALGLYLASCGGAPESAAKTTILCVWDSVEIEGLQVYGSEIDSTPVLTQLASSGEVMEGFFPQSGSATSAMACLLTGVGPEKHGLRSIHELGANMLWDEARTIAEDLNAQGWRTLAAVSQAHFGWGGMQRGFDVWQGPELREPRRTHMAQQVFEGLRPELEAALASTDNVFVVLQFSDLRGRSWESREPSEELLQAYLKEWRGQGGVIDAEFAATDEELSLARRLASALLRRTDDPRKTAMLSALHASGLGELDGQLGELRSCLEASGRLAKAAILVVGGPAEDVTGNVALERPALPFIRIGSSELLDDLYQVGEGESEQRSRTRQITVRVGLAAYDGLQVTGSAPGGTLELIGEGAGDTAAPRDRLAAVVLEEQALCVQLNGSRGEFILRLQHPKLFGLGDEDLTIGGLSLEESDLPVLLASRSPEWPENAIVGPLLDLQSAGGRRLKGTLNSKPLDRVEILVESFPPDYSLPEKVKVEGGEVARHELRPGAVWLRGTGAMTFELPPRSPKERLGLVMRLNGKRIHGSRIRYLARTFSDPGQLELGGAPGVWLEKNLVGKQEPPVESAISIELVDEYPGSTSISVPSPAQLEYMWRLGENE